MNKETVFMSELRRKADKLEWQGVHENAYSSTVGKCSISVSKDVLGYIVTLYDNQGQTILSSRSKDAESIYGTAQMRALQISEDLKNVLRVLETL
jgi:hypothetical protein